MNKQSKDADSARKSPNVDDRTPNADMQPEDTGTADSGAAGQASEGDKARAAMKQTSKTAAETGGKQPGTSGKR
ncbi:MAG: hypothetical protein V4787_22380 [Pseudomonadota bacterium]